VEITEGIREKRVEELVFYVGRGCEHCSSTGKSGQIGIFELLAFSGGLQEFLMNGSPSKIIYDEAQRRGMRTLREDGIMKANLGLVDVRDVLEETQTAGWEG
jgi:type II secretory ATPase GspE/PulE/Tfp pilus assembly ATPase PilB-like protein